MSYRIYLGNLDHSTTKENLEELFDKLSLNYSSILPKNGYAFVESPDQTSFDQTIDLLNGYSFLGSVVNAEPSTVSRKRKGRKIQIKNLPTNYNKEDIEVLVASKGKVQQCDIVTSMVDAYVLVVYDSSDEAQKAINELNNFEFNGSVLQAEYFIRNDSRTSRKTRTRGSDMFSLRILVPSDLIGAIIGRKGQTIQTITSMTSVSRIDVHGKDNFGFAEKVIFITSKDMESITSACKEILKVMKKEMQDNNLGDPVLKILADDRYCGRLIGKEGKIIKKIRDDTNTKIAISDEMVMTFPDRVISIRGDSIDRISNAEAEISLILKECLDKDGQQRFASMNGGRLMSTSNSLMPLQRLYGPMIGRDGRSGKSQLQNMSETYYISVPNAAIGAIIGTAGTNIKQIIRDSRAAIFIEGRSKGDSSPSTERSITIKGNADSFWRASFYVFEKMKIEGFAGNEEVRLRTLMPVPKALVGRIIGKGGKHARDVELATGAIIRITDDAKAKEEEAMLEVFGTFTSTQGAISRVRTVISQPPRQSPRTQERGDPDATSN